MDMKNRLASWLGQWSFANYVFDTGFSVACAGLLRAFAAASLMHLIIFGAGVFIAVLGAIAMWKELRDKPEAQAVAMSRKRQRDILYACREHGSQLKALLNSNQDQRMLVAIRDEMARWSQALTGIIEAAMGN